MTKVTRLTLDDEGGLNRRRIHLREISGDLDSPLETVGQDLRAARLRRGDELATVSRALKIRKEHLEALEEDRIEALPGRTYAIGFIRSYADYLGLDGVQCVERFKAEIAGRNEDVAHPITVIDEDDRHHLPHGWWVIAGVVLLLVFYGAFQLMQTADKTLSSDQGNESPQQLAANPTPPPPRPALKPAPVVTPPAPQANIAVPAATPTDAAKTALNAASAGVPPPASTQQLMSSGVGAPAPAVPLPQGQVYGEQNKNARVVLRILQPAKILIEGSDGKLFLNRTLKPGDIYRVPNLVGLSLTTPNGGAIELDLDGQAIGHVGKAGEISESISLDPQAIMDRYGR